MRRPHNNKVELNHLKALGAESLLVFRVELAVKLLSEKAIIVILIVILSKKVTIAKMFKNILDQPATVATETFLVKYLQKKMLIVDE